jgi:hypothetical protein
MGLLVGILSVNKALERLEDSSFGREGVFWAAPMHKYNSPESLGLCQIFFGRFRARNKSTWLGETITIIIIWEPDERAGVVSLVVV